MEMIFVAASCWIRLHARPDGEWLILIVHRLEPGFFPEQQAGRLTAAMRGPVASEIRQMDGILHPPTAAVRNRVAGLVGARRYDEGVTTESEHLGHEGKGTQSASLVEGGEDLLTAPDPNAIAPAQTQGMGNGPIDGSHAKTHPLSDRDDA